MNRQKPTEHRLRTYRRGDGEALISLFNRVYENFAGFVPRTLEYWSWCVLSHPDLSEEGIVVAINAGRVVGYAAIERSGNILEFCHDPDYDGKTLVLNLLNWCVNYAEYQGANSVGLNAPVQDNIIHQVCRESGFTEESFPSLFLRVLDLEVIFRKIEDQRTNVDKSLNEAILMNLKNFPSSCPQHLAILIRGGEITFSTEKLKQPTIKIDVDISTISSCIFGSKKTLYGALLKRRLKIRPLRKVLKAVKVLSWFQLENPPWYVPKADYG